MIHALALGKERAVLEVSIQQDLQDPAGKPAAFGHLRLGAEHDEPLEQFLQVGARDARPLLAKPDRPVFDGAVHEEAVEPALVLDVGFGLAPLHPEQRRLRDEDVAAVDHLGVLPIEERQQQRADVRAVHVRVRHDDDAVVPQFLDVEILFADAAAKRGDEHPDFVTAQHLVEAGLLDIEDLAFERQDRLEAPVAALLGRAAGRFALDQVQLA